MYTYIQQNIIGLPKGSGTCIYDTTWIYLKNVINKKCLLVKSICEFMFMNYPNQANLKRRNLD